MKFNTEVIGSYWNEDAGQWTVRLRQTSPSSAPREFEDKCDLLLHATGILNNFKWPEIEGMKNFKGKVVRKWIARQKIASIVEQNRHRTLAGRLSEGAMEGRVSSHYWFRGLFHPDTANYAASC